VYSLEPLSSLYSCALSSNNVMNYPPDARVVLIIVVPELLSLVLHSIFLFFALIYLSSLLAFGSGVWDATLDMVNCLLLFVSLYSFTS